MQIVLSVGADEVTDVDVHKGSSQQLTVESTQENMFDPNSEGHEIYYKETSTNSNSSLNETLKGWIS